MKLIMNILIFFLFFFYGPPESSQILTKCIKFLCGSQVTPELQDPEEGPVETDPPSPPSYHTDSSDGISRPRWLRVGVRGTSDTSDAISRPHWSEVEVQGSTGSESLEEGSDAISRPPWSEVEGQGLTGSESQEEGSAQTIPSPPYSHHSELEPHHEGGSSVTHPSPPPSNHSHASDIARPQRLEEEVPGSRASDCSSRASDGTSSHSSHQPLSSEVSRHTSPVLESSMVSSPGAEEPAQEPRVITENRRDSSTRETGPVMTSSPQSDSSHRQRQSPSVPGPSPALPVVTTSAGPASAVRAGEMRVSSSRQHGQKRTVSDGEQENSARKRTRTDNQVNFQLQ